MLGTAFKQSTQKIPTAQLRGQWDRSLAALKRKQKEKQKQRAAEDHAIAEKIAHKERCRIKRHLAEEKLRLGRYLFWEWQNVVKWNRVALKNTWDRSDYTAKHSHGYTLMTQAQNELAALPCA